MHIVRSVGGASSPARSATSSAASTRPSGGHGPETALLGPSVPGSGPLPHPATAHLDRPLHLVGLPAVLRAASRAAAVLCLLIGVSVLAGYAFRWRAAVELHPSLPPMYPNAALGFVLGGVSALLAASHRRSSQRAAVVGFAVVLLGAAITFVLHLVDAGPTVVEILWREDFVPATTPVGGRPVVETCVAFLGAGSAGIVLATRRSARWAQGLALGCVSVGAAAVLGFVIGVDRVELGTSFVVVGMALHTGVGLFLLGAAILLAQPTAGLFARLTHAGPSARLSRRLVAVVVVAPIAITALNALLSRTLPDAALVQSVMAIAQVLVLGLLVMLPLSAADEVELRAERTLREARAVRERIGEQDTISSSLVSLLLERPPSPSGWEVGFRQSAAFAALPGDSCQVVTRDDGSFLVALVDVAGHGTVPALEALRLRFEIGALWAAGVGVGAIADVVDASVAEMDTIATGVLVAVDAEGGCEYVNAGHPPVLALTGSSTETWGRTSPLFGLGANPAGRRAAQRRDLGRGALLVLYTDGVTEARAPDDSQLGTAAIEHAVRVHGPAGPQAIADACLDAALSHSHARLRDDALALVLRRT